MKSKFTLLSLLLVVAINVSFMLSPKQTDPNNIIGKWDFVEMLDENGKHIDTLWENKTYVVPKEATYIFKKDKTYSARFTDINIDTGTWAYDATKKEILLMLYLKKPYTEVAQYIISLGYAQKDKNGDYYDLIPKKVLELTDTKLVLETKSNKSVFKRNR